MNQDEKLALVFGYFSSDAPWKEFEKPKEGLEQSAGFIPDNSRLGIPALTETDAGIGVASQPGEHPRLRTALPSNLATAATWDPELAYAMLARRSDVAIVFAHQSSVEGRDGTLRLDDDQDALIKALAKAVAKANSKTIVVLETGGPVLMPWIDEVAAVVHAWYARVCICLGESSDNTAAAASRSR